MSGGGSPPPDNTMAIMQMQNEQAQQAQAAADAKAAQQASDLANLRASSAASGTSQAQDYFSQKGLDPGQYANTIDSTISGILAGINPTDPNPGAQFQDVGARAYNTATQAAQSRAGQQINSLFPQNFEMNRVTNDTLAPYLAGIDAQQRSSADDIIQNMLARGVITASGKAAAEQELDRQNAGVMAQLQQIGTGTVATEQQNLRNIADQGRSAAQTLTLGDQFDPSQYSSQADKQFQDFINNLNTTIQGKIGSANLFNTTGLAAIAGAGQGAGNTAFDPTAAAGVIDPNNPSSTTQQGTQQQQNQQSNQGTTQSSNVF